MHVYTCIYIYIHTPHTYTHTHIYIYILFLLCYWMVFPSGVSINAQLLGIIESTAIRVTKQSCEMCGTLWLRYGHDAIFLITEEFLDQKDVILCFYDDHDISPGQWCISLFPGGRFKNTYELLNLRALKISKLHKNHIFQCMGKIFCVEFQRVPFKFHTKYLTHTLKDVDFIHIWKFKSS